MRTRGYLQAALLGGMLVITDSSANTDEQYDCEFPVGDGERSVRSIALSDEVYTCMKFDDYRDTTVINAENQAVPFRVVAASSDKNVERFTRELEYHDEPVSSTYRTREQMRRITALTGVESSHSMDEQWHNANSFYTAILVDQQGDFEGRLERISFELKAGTQPVTASVMIEASDDLQHWRTILAPHGLYRLSGTGDGAGLQESTYDLGYDASSRYLRIAVLSNQQDFTRVIDRIVGEYIHTTIEPPALRWMTMETPVALDSENAWLLHVDGLLPISELRLAPRGNVVLYKGELYSRPHENPAVAQTERQLREQGKAKIKNAIRSSIKGANNEPGDDETRWRYVSGFMQYELMTDSGNLASLGSRFPVQRTDAFKIVFSQPAGMRPEQLPVIDLGYRPARIEFLAQGNGPFHLVVGRDVAADRVPFPSAFDTAAVEQVVLGARTDNGGFAVPKQEPDHADESGVKMNEILLWAVLLFGVGLLAAMAYQISRSMKGAGS